MIILDDAFEEGSGVIVLSNGFPEHSSASFHLQQGPSSDRYDLIIDFKDCQEVETECYCIEGLSLSTVDFLLDSGSATVFASTGESLRAPLSTLEQTNKSLENYL